MRGIKDARRARGRHGRPAGAACRRTVARVSGARRSGRGAVVLLPRHAGLAVEHRRRGPPRPHAGGAPHPPRTAWLRPVDGEARPPAARLGARRRRARRPTRDRRPRRRRRLGRRPARPLLCRRVPRPRHRRGHPQLARAGGLPGRDARDVVRQPARAVAATVRPWPVPPRDGGQRRRLPPRSAAVPRRPRGRHVDIRPKDHATPRGAHHAHPRSARGRAATLRSSTEPSR